MQSEKKQQSKRKGGEYMHYKSSSFFVCLWYSEGFIRPQKKSIKGLPFCQDIQKLEEKKTRQRCSTDFLYHIPTDTFTIPEPQDHEIGEFYVVQKRRATDFKAPKLWKGRSGYVFWLSFPATWEISAYSVYIKKKGKTCRMLFMQPFCSFRWQKRVALYNQGRMQKNHHLNITYSKTARALNLVGYILSGKRNESFYPLPLMHGARWWRQRQILLNYITPSFF